MRLRTLAVMRSAALAPLAVVRRPGKLMGSEQPHRQTGSDVPSLQ